MRMIPILLALSFAGAAASPQKDGEALFKECEFKAAARVFEHALATEPDSPHLHFWLGKSYERMAEVSSPFFARRNGRKAQLHLEAALRGDPGNREYLKELFDLYTGFPDWFHGALTRAHQIAGRLGTDSEDTKALNLMVSQAQSEYSSREWVLGKPILRISSMAGYLVPHR